MWGRHHPGEATEEEDSVLPWMVWGCLGGLRALHYMCVVCLVLLYCKA